MSSFPLARHAKAPLRAIRKPYYATAVPSIELTAARTTARSHKSQKKSSCHPSGHCLRAEYEKNSSASFYKILSASHVSATKKNTEEPVANRKDYLNITVSADHWRKSGNAAKITDQNIGRHYPSPTDRAIGALVRSKICLKKTSTALACLLLLASTAQAAEGPDFTRAWAWADKATAPINVEQPVSPYYKHSSSFRRLTFWPYRQNKSTDVFQTRTGVGKYRVRIDNGAVAGGTTQISAYGGSHYCKVVNWYASRADQIINVACYSRLGQPQNGKFTVLFFNNEEKPDYYTDAYLWASQPTTSSYIANSRYSYNSGGGSNKIERSRTGLYVVYLPKMHNVFPYTEVNKGGTVMVTAYGAGATNCHPVNWYPSGQTMTVRVECRNASGRRVDSQFVLGFNKDIGTVRGRVAEDTLQGAYAWARDMDTVPAYYQKNYGSAMTSRKLGTGRAVVEIPGLRPVGATVQLKAYGVSNRRCSIDRWASSSVYSVGTAVYVSCRAPSGYRADAPFVIQFLRPERILY